MRTRIKICGITRPEDGLLAARCGADAIGLVFYEKSPRAVTLAQAEAVIAALPAFVSVVALFVNAAPEQIRDTLAALDIDLIQFHGDESAAECERYARPYIKAMRMCEQADVVAAARRYQSARALLLDGYQPGVPGGTGVTFDWSRVPGEVSCPLIVAGGLNADNVATAIRHTRPYAVDVSGGVEQSKGIKDARKIAQFIEGVNRVNAI